MMSDCSNQMSCKKFPIEVLEHKIFNPKSKLLKGRKFRPKEVVIYFWICILIKHVIYQNFYSLNVIFVLIIGFDSGIK